MKRNLTAGPAAFLGASLLALAVAPVALAGAAHAAPATPYADQVAIGTAVKIGNPDVVGKQAAAAATDTATTNATAQGTDPAEDSSTATPTGAVVVETESHQAESSATDTSVAVLGTKVGSDEGTLANTGPHTVTYQALLAVALILIGAALRGGPQLALAVRRSGTRRH